MLLPLWREYLKQEEFHEDRQERAKSKTETTELNRKEVYPLRKRDRLQKTSNFNNNEI